MTIAAQPLAISVPDAASLDAELNAAVELALQDALRERKGILVTHQGPGRYTVELSGDVAFGTTE
jgi:hypothetical protein